MVKGAGCAARSVYPSGSAAATTPAPRLPPAPGRSSTMTGWPHRFCSRSANSRATISGPPAAGADTMMRTKRLG